MTTQLIFKSRVLEAVEHEGQIWFTASTLATALNYSRGDHVTRIYSRNADEFTPSMSINVNMTFNGINNSLRMKAVRVFSLRGAHLIAMFASTPVAKEFRKWLLDLIEHHYGEPIVTPAPARHVSEPISAEGMRYLTHLVWHMSHRMQSEQSWSNGIWHCLRSVTGRAYPQRYCLDDRPALEEECRRIMKVTCAFNAAVYNFEKDVIRLVVRRRQDIEPLIAVMEEQMRDITERYNSGLLALGAFEENSLRKLVSLR